MTIQFSGPLAEVSHRPFSVADVERMVELGIIHADERIELVDGELLRMSAKGYRHEILEQALLERWYRGSPEGVRIIPETTYRLLDDTFLEPDILVYPSDPGLKDLKGPGALLVVEISDTTLGYDLGVKAAVYARAGVPEYWAIDAERLLIHAHRRPAPQGYGDISILPPSETVQPERVPAFALRLGDLELGR